MNCPYTVDLKYRMHPGACIQQCVAPKYFRTPAHLMLITLSQPFFIIVHIVNTSFHVLLTDYHGWCPRMKDFERPIFVAHRPRCTGVLSGGLESANRTFFSHFDDYLIRMLYKYSY